MKRKCLRISICFVLIIDPKNNYIVELSHLRRNDLRKLANYYRSKTIIVMEPLIPGPLQGFSNTPVLMI